MVGYFRQGKRLLQKASHNWVEHGKEEQGEFDEQFAIQRPLSSMALRSTSSQGNMRQQVKSFGYGKQQTWDAFFYPTKLFSTADDAKTIAVEQPNSWADERLAFRNA